MSGRICSYLIRGEDGKVYPCPRQDLHWNCGHCLLHCDCSPLRGRSCVWLQGWHSADVAFTRHAEPSADTKLYHSSFSTVGGWLVRNTRSGGQKITAVSDLYVRPWYRLPRRAWSRQAEEACTELIYVMAMVRDGTVRLVDIPTGKPGEVYFDVPLPWWCSKYLGLNGSTVKIVHYGWWISKAPEPHGGEGPQVEEGRLLIPSTYEGTVSQFYPTAPSVAEVVRPWEFSGPIADNGFRCIRLKTTATDRPVYVYLSDIMSRVNRYLIVDSWQLKRAEMNGRTSHMAGYTRGAYLCTEQVRSTLSSKIEVIDIWSLSTELTTLKLTPTGVRTARGRIQRAVGLVPGNTTVDRLSEMTGLKPDEVIDALACPEFDDIVHPETGCYTRLKGEKINGSTSIRLAPMVIDRLIGVILYVVGGALYEIDSGCPVSYHNGHVTTMETRGSGSLYEPGLTVNGRIADCKSGTEE